MLWTPPAIRLMLLRLAVGLLAAAVLALDGGTALGQAANCGQLNAMLSQLSSNSDFRSTDQANENLRALQGDERNAERAYVREGCQRDQQQGAPQTPVCRSYAQKILSERDQITQLSQSTGNANAVAQQRQQVLQQMARYGCTQANSGATFTSNGAPQRRNFLQNLFGGQTDYGDQGVYDDQQQVEDPYGTGGQGSTIRTVCVRFSDGYYWPISYSTTRDYVGPDEAECEAECPNQQVELYYYDNPGQEPEQMVDPQGNAYTALPNAFAYRKNFDLSNSCKPQETTGSIGLQDLGNGLTRAMVTYGGETFPLPIRDPRVTETATAAAASQGTYVNVPLPRPRPDRTATAVVVAVPTAAPAVSVPGRTVKVGDKIVRVVGPDTPYAPPTLSPGSSG